MNDNEVSNNEIYPKPLEAQVERVITPFQAFIRDQTTGSLFLMLCTVVALIIANSPFVQHYEALIEMPMGFVIGEWTLNMSVRHWVNDGLMSLFFFVLGLEIKREIIAGELKEPRQSLPVIAAALGGMIVPAVVYVIFNYASQTTSHGWGIPMATDTAFAVGVLALLGRRIPVALIAFLTALAIIDDLGAILVIAAFYTDTIHLSALGFSGLFLALLVACNLVGFRHPVIYAIGGVMVWFALHKSGVHATVAGIAVALTVPARPTRGPKWFMRRTRRLVNEFERMEEQSTSPILGEAQQHAVVERVQDTAEKATTPLRRWERTLEHPVALLVMPIFALVNAGIPIDFNLLSTLWTDALGAGIIAGLVVGKCMGISLFAWFALRLNIGQLPTGVNMHHIIGIGLLGGMGFTMSIFIAGLGFANNADALVTAKTAILLATLIAGVSGYLWLRLRS